MSPSIPLRCACGNVRGELLDASPATGSRLVCYCDDCQAYAQFLGGPDLLDAFGGTDVFQTTPSRLRITQGFEHLRVVRLSENGLVRWRADCCRTPVANILAMPRLPFVGLVLAFVDVEGEGNSRDERFGAPTAYTQGRFAPGGCPPHAHPSASLPVIASSAWRLLRGALEGGHRPTPFFDDKGVLTVVPRVLEPAERAALAELGLPPGPTPSGTTPEGG